MDHERLFAADGDRIYLNHASSSPLPIPTMRRMKSMIDELANGDLPWDRWLEILEGFRRGSGRLIGAGMDEICFVPNTSTGLLIALYTIPWQKGDSMVCLRDGFPANRVPWMANMGDRGIERREIVVEGERDVEARIEEAVDRTTRALVVDWVDFFTGYRLDLERLGDLCEDRDMFLVVDGIQGAGVMDIDISRTKVDFFSSGSGKWLLGPIGAGFLYIAEPTMERIRPALQGWMGRDWRDFNVLDPLPEVKRGAGRFEIGSYPGVPLVGFLNNLKILNGIGIPEIENRVSDLRDRLEQGLVGSGGQVQLVSPDAPEHSSGITSFRLGQHGPGQNGGPGSDDRDQTKTSVLHQALLRENVVTSLRRGAIRVSPHFYNRMDQMEKVIDLVQDFTGN